MTLGRRVMLTLAALAAVLAPTATASAAALSWSAPELIAHQPPWNAGYLSDVSCPSSSFCVGVDFSGYIVSSSDPVAGAAAWKVVQIPGVYDVKSVSCPSDSVCVAVDQAGDVITTSDPTGGSASWNVAPVVPGETNPPGQLDSVSCPTTSLCVAVGDSTMITSTDPTGGLGAWKVEYVAGADDDLTAISCPSAALCVATDGDILTSTDPAGGATSYVDTSGVDFAGGGPTALSCPSAQLCVGVDYNGDMVTSTDPTGGRSAWQVANVDGHGDTTNGPYLQAVSCGSDSLCVAVDSEGNMITSSDPAGGAPAWTVTHTGSAYFEGVSCTPDSFCIAVAGDAAWTSTDPAGPASAWTVKEIDATNDLMAISCPSVSLCVAADSGGNVVTSTTPAGGPGAWTVTQAAGQTFPLAQYDPHQLTAISCPSVSLCVATDTIGDVATSTSPTGGETAWTFGPTGGPGPLTGVTCPSTSMCVAASGNDVLISTDPGASPSTWTATQIGGLATISTVSCPSTSLCLALEGGEIVSSTDPTGGAATWIPVAADPQQPSEGNLTALSCPSTGFCAAVDTAGNVVTSTDPTGGPDAWSVLDIDGTAPLVGISCATVSLCVAVDTSGGVLVSTNPTGDAAAWQRSDIDQVSQLDAVACPSTAECVVVDNLGQAIVGQSTGAPAIVTRPAIAQTPSPGTTLNATPGTWTASPSGVSYQWERCNAYGVACAAAAGATSRSYAVTARDIGDSLRVTETTANGSGSSGPIASDATVVVRGPVPAEVSPPTISGTAVEGQTLTEGHGQWSESPTSFSYQWEDCDGSGGSCTPIGGAIGASYIVATSDVGSTLRVVETATNAYGTGPPVSSAPTAVVEPLPPSNVAAPTVSGDLTAGQILTEAHGQWRFDPTSYSYQWQDCAADGTACTAVAGATQQSYRLAPADVGHAIRVQETATNAGGSGGPISSAATAPVRTATAPPSRPSNSAPPTVSGIAAQGDVLTANPGAWSGTPPLSFAYQWQLCTRACAPAAGGEGQVLALGPGSVGARVRVIVAATNGQGTQSAASAEIGPVIASPPSSASLRALLGRLLAPARGARIVRRLLSRGGWVESFVAPVPAVISIRWTALRTGRPGRRIALARCTLTIDHAGNATLAIRPTSGGRRLLHDQHRIAVAASGLLERSGYPTITAHKTFTLAR